MKYLLCGSNPRPPAPVVIRSDLVKLSGLGGYWRLFRLRLLNPVFFFLSVETVLRLKVGLVLLLHG